MQKAALGNKIYREEFEVGGIKFITSINITLLVVGGVSLILSIIVIGDTCCNKYKRRNITD